MAKKPNKFPQSIRVKNNQERKEFKRQADKFAPDYKSERKFMVIRDASGNIIPPPEGIEVLKIARRN